MTSSVADGSHVFLEHVHSLWKHDRGESPPSVTVSDGVPVAEIVKGKLRGKFEWPFSFPFPKDFPYFGKDELWIRRQRGLQHIKCIE